MAVMVVMQLEYAEVEPLERVQLQHEWELGVAAAAELTVVVVGVLAGLVVQVVEQPVLLVPVEVPELVVVVVVLAVVEWVEFPSLVQVQF